MVILRIALPLVLVGGPIALAVWLGTRLRGALAGFLVAWAATPVAMLAALLVLLPFLQLMTPAGNDGTWAIMIPIYGIVLGIGAGVVAAVMICRRPPMGAASAPPEDSAPQR